MLVIHRRIAPQALWAAELLLNFEAKAACAVSVPTVKTSAFSWSVASHRCTMANSCKPKTDASYAYALDLNNSYT